MIHQAYYQSIESPVGFAGLSPDLASSDAKQWTSYLGYEFPRGCVRAEDAPVRYSVVDPPGEYRLVLTTTPVAGSRTNKSITHVLAIPKGQYPLTELLCGYGCSTWMREMPEHAPAGLDSLPWNGRQDKLDRDLTEWLADHENFALARFVLAGHLSLPAGRQLFLAVDSDKLFWAVYAAVRLLPRAAAESLTFATYQHDPTYRTERVVGTSAPLPSGCGRNGDRTHDTTVGVSPVPPAGAPRDYADRILKCWLAPVNQTAVDAFLAEAATVDNPDVLDVWLRVKVDPGKTSDDELVALAANPFWADKIAASRDLFFRVVGTGRIHLGSLLCHATEPRRRDYLTEVVSRLETAIVTGNVVDTAAWLDRLNGFPAALAANGHRAVENLPPAGSAAVCRLLIGRLEKLDCRVLALEDRQTRELINDIGPVPPEKVARWLVSGFPRELSEKTWERALTLDALRQHLLGNVVDLSNGASILAKCLRGQAAPQALIEIRSAAIAIVRKNRRSEITEEVVRALIGNNAHPPRKWVPAVASEFQSWGSTSREFRAELIAYLAADPDGTIADNAVRGAALALPTADLYGRLPPRWIALAQWHELATGNQAVKADECARCLKILHEWGLAFPNSPVAKSTGLTGFPAGLIRDLAVSSVSRSVPDVPAAERVFREWIVAVGSVWATAKRNFVRDVVDGIDAVRMGRADAAPVVRAAIIRWAKSDPEPGDSLLALVAYLRELETQSPSALDEAREYAVRDEWPPSLRAALWPERRVASPERPVSVQHAPQSTRRTIELQHRRQKPSDNSKSIAEESWWLLYVVTIVAGVAIFMSFLDSKSKNDEGAKSSKKPKTQQNTIH